MTKVKFEVTIELDQRFMDSMLVQERDGHPVNYVKKEVKELLFRSLVCSNGGRYDISDYITDAWIVAKRSPK